MNGIDAFIYRITNICLPSPRPPPPSSHRRNLSADSPIDVDSSRENKSCSGRIKYYLKQVRTYAVWRDDVERRRQMRCSRPFARDVRRGLSGSRAAGEARRRRKSTPLFTALPAPSNPWPVAPRTTAGCKCPLQRMQSVQLSSARGTTLSRGPTFWRRRRRRRHTSKR